MTRPARKQDAPATALPLEPVVHARVLRYVGHAGTSGRGWAGHGRRTYREANERNGEAATVCGLTLQSIENARVASTAMDANGARLPDFATLKSPGSRERAYVTCPDCLRGIGERP